MAAERAAEMPVLGCPVGGDMGLATHPAELGGIQEQIRSGGSTARKPATRALAVELLARGPDQLELHFTTEAAAALHLHGGRRLACRNLGPLSWRNVACGHFRLPRAGG